MAKRKSKVKFGPFVFGHTQLIAQDGQTFELWNNLKVFFEQRQVQRALKIPSGVLPVGPHGKLVLGQGGFGIVRLAKQGAKFLAVKKSVWEHGKTTLEEQTAYREYCFSRELIEQKIENVMTVEAILDASNLKGKHTLYQFMPLATLGDGSNLKKLLKNLTKESRDEVLIYATFALVNALAQMHECQMYHRDVKAANLLVNHDGSIYLSDFGSATISRPVAFNNNNPFTVSDDSDFRYMSPEIIDLVLTGSNVTALNLSLGLDSWRLGLTLLQLCGCIKENEGILANFMDMSQEIKDGFPEFYHQQIQLLKETARDKIPSQLYDIIFSLLEVDYYKRATPQAIQQHLLQMPVPQKKDMAPIFDVLTRYHIPQVIINGLSSALKKEICGDPLKEFEKQFPPNSDMYIAKSEELMMEYKLVHSKFKKLLDNPEIRLHDLNEFIRQNINDSKNVVIKQDQFTKIIAMIRLRTLEKNQSIPIMLDDFKASSIQKMKDDFAGIIASIKANHENIPAELFDLLTLTYQIKKTEYFAKSYTQFHSVKKDFHETLKAFNVLRNRHAKFAKQIYQYFKDELTYLNQEILHSIDGRAHADLLNRYEKIINIKDVLLEVFNNSDISNKKIAQFLKLLQEIEANKVLLQEAEEISQNSLMMSHTREPFLKKEPTQKIMPALPERVLGQHREKQFKEWPAGVEKENITVPSEEDSYQPYAQGKEKIIEEPIVVPVVGTTLSYLRYEKNSIYRRSKNYLEDYSDSHLTEKEHIHKAGYTEEEKKLLVQMADEFLESHQDFVILKGNKHLTRLLANYIHHRKPSVKIHVNGVPFQDALTHQFEKMIHPIEASPPPVKNIKKPEHHH